MREKLARRVWTRLDESHHQQLLALAEVEGRSICNMIRRLVEESLSQRERMAAGSQPAQGGVHE